MSPPPRHTPRRTSRAKNARTYIFLAIIALVVIAAGVIYTDYADAGSPRHVPAGHKAFSSVITTPTTLPGIAPLTGLPPTNPAVLQRPAISVKIDDDAAAQPQSGINQADLVYEEVVEGGIDRWLAVFQSQGASDVGPVRSVRDTDADLVAPIGGLFAYSGGIPAFVSDVMATGVKDVGADSGDPSAYTRDPDRSEPDNLYTSTALLWQAEPQDTTPPPALFHYRTLGVHFEAAGASTVGSVSITMSGVTTVGWTWDASAGVWDRAEGGEASDDASGDPIAFTNVIVEYVPYHDTGYIDPAGNPVPDADTIGTGPALVFSDGSVARGTWTKEDEDAITTYEDSDGNPIRLTPGNTWVELLPTGQPAPQCTGGSGLASQICASLAPES